MQYRMLVLATTLIVALLGSHMVSGMPQKLQDALRQSEQNPQIRAFNTCDISRDVRDMCKRCAKVTKARVAYKLCCDDEDDSKNWCEDFLRTGHRY